MTEQRVQANGWPTPSPEVRRDLERRLVAWPEPEREQPAVQPAATQPR